VTVHIVFGFVAGIVTIRLAGQYLVADAKTAIRMVLPGDTYELRGTVLDLRESQSVRTRTRAELEAIGTFFAELRQNLGGRLALVVNDQLAYGLTRVVAAWAGINGLPVRAFFDEASAVAWLKGDPVDPPDAA
jgi:hypothetical protein